MGQTKTINRTKRLGRAVKSLSLLSVLLTIGPALTYFVMALLTDSLVQNKVTLTMGALIYLILSMVTLISKHTYKSKIWILLIGLYLIVDKFALCIIIIGVTQLIDELIVCPVRHNLKTKYIANKEMDKRGAD